LKSLIHNAREKEIEKFQFLT